MKYAHVIWDFNGTLLDDARLCWRIGNGMLLEDGRDPITYDQYLRWVDFPIQRFYENLGYSLSPGEYVEVSEAYHRLYDSRLPEAGLQEGVDAVLEALEDAGVTQSILSAYHQDGLDREVARLGITGYFTDVIGLSDKLGRSKVQTALDWMRIRGLSPGEIVMVGDTTHDAEVTAALGCDCVLYSGGHNDRERLIESGLPVIDHMDELLPFFIG